MTNQYVLEFDEVRRLTGPNLLSDKPGALVDANLSGIEHDKVWQCWQKHMRSILAELGWENQHLYYRAHDLGISLAISAPLDALYSACEAAELAWHLTASEFTGAAYQDEDGNDPQQKLQLIKQQLAEEVNPALLKLIELSEQHNVTWLTDDDEFSLGTGATAKVWPVNQLPDPASINWQSFKTIPGGFITGTNGKSTSVRLASTIAKCAGKSAGITSTDFIRVGDTVLDKGDYSGPGGARILLRHEKTEIAFLEVARGGILRRGLPVFSFDAALITNIAADHLGQYGINTVEELSQAKFVVDKGLHDNGTIVLNADDQLLVKRAESTKHNICWFSLVADNPLIVAHKKLQKPVVYLQDNHIHYQFGDDQFSVHVNDVTMTFNGAATYNISNAMGVIGFCKAMGFANQHIIEGLKAFGSDAADNPGRGNQYQYNGATVFVDFAHNQHGVKAVVEMAKNISAKRRFVMFSHAGDRSNQDMFNLTSEVVAFEADQYVIAELEVYLRGREEGEVPKLVSDYLQSKNIAAEKIVVADSPLDGAKKILPIVGEGDVVLLFALDQREEIDQLLRGNV